MKLYVHYETDNITIILKISEEISISDLIKLFVEKAQEKHHKGYDAKQFIATNQRHVKIQGNVSKVLDSGDDVYLWTQQEFNEIKNNKKKNTTNVDVQTRVSYETQTNTNEQRSVDVKKVEEKSYREERVVNDNNGKSYKDYRVTVDNEETNTSENIPIDKLLSAIPAKIDSICPLCGEWNNYDSSAKEIRCGNCKNDLLCVRIVDAQTDCSRCKKEIFRTRGNIIMECDQCSFKTSVVQCNKCNTPFIFPWGIETMNCVSCGTNLTLNNIKFTPPMKFGILVNKVINEPPELVEEFKGKNVLGKTVHLITQYYKDNSSERQKEIDLCLEKNIENKHIDQIHLLLESEDVKIPTNYQVDKVKITVIGKRWKFRDAFEYCNRELSGLVCIVANSDIYFDQSINHILRQRTFTGQFISLTRYDVTKENTLRFNEWTASFCQDAWIFESPLPLNTIDTDYYFGWMGCDNRIAYEIKHNARPAFHIYNPCYLVCSRHLHSSNKRNYTPENKVEGNYAVVHPNSDL
jgi:hypothetical protein